MSDVTSPLPAWNISKLNACASKQSSPSTFTPMANTCARHRWRLPLRRELCALSYHDCRSMSNRELLGQKGRWSSSGSETKSGLQPFKVGSELQMSPQC